MKNKAADIINLEKGELVSLAAGVGFNNLAMYVSSQNAAHKYDNFGRVVVKFYRLDRDASSVEKLLDFHKSIFHRLTSIAGNPHIQQSIDAGVYTDKYDKKYPFVILKYVEGKTLHKIFESKIPITKDIAASIFRKLFNDIIIPTWNAGLRFSDIQSRNIILDDCARLALIDTEQMRNSAVELLYSPAQWEYRKNVDEHIAFNSASGKFDGMGRMATLVKNLVLSTLPPVERKDTLRQEKLFYDISQFFTCGARLSSELSKLGVNGDLHAIKESLDMLEGKIF